MKQFDQQPSPRANPFIKIYAAALLFCCMAFGYTASALTIAPTTLTDPNYTTINNANGMITGGAGVGLISLRSALQACDQTAGPHIINLTLPGTYQVTGGTNTGTYIIFGSTNNENITINGLTPATSIINMSGAGSFQDRIFGINVATLGGTLNVKCTINNCRFTNGHLNFDPYGGGAIEFASSGNGSALTLNGCEFINNTIDPTAGTTGGAVNYSGSGTLTVTNTTFTGNTNDDANGGALYYFFNNLDPANTGLMNVNNCTFTNNSATAATGSGGAIGIALQGRNSVNQNFTANILENNFITNTAPLGDGGAMIVNNGDAAYILNINYNRFFNNSTSSTTAATSGLGKNSSSGNVNATNNWWGCNTDPTTAGACNRAAIVGSGGTGVLTTNPWLKEKTTATTNPICNTAAGLGNSTTVTTSFLSNSAGTAIPVSNLDRLIGLPVVWSATLGSLSGQQLTIQNTGTATATFTSNGTGGTATVDARVDNVPLADADAEESITVNTLPAVTNPANFTSCVGGIATFTSTITGTPAPGVVWRIGTTALVNGVQGSGSTVSGQGTNTLTITNVQPGDAAVNYNVQASNQCGVATSTNATLFVNQVTGGTVGSDQTVCSPGDPAAFTESVASTGSGTLTYQWQSSTTGCAAGFSDIGGATGTTYDAPAGLAVTTFYHRVTTSTLNALACTATSGCITVTVNNVTGGTVGANQIICSGGDPAAFAQTVVSTGSGALTYQWQSGTTSCAAGFSDIGGATGTTYDAPSGLAITTFYHRVTTSTLPGSQCTATGNCITVTVNPTNTITLTSGAGTDAQTVLPSTPIINITYSTTAATGATFSGLPPGVSGIWSANTVTISGSPTALGLYNYTVTLTGGCGVVTATGSINVVVCAITLTSGAGTNIAGTCLNTLMTPITYSTTSATGISFSGLPPGVTAAWAANVVTISGTPTSLGTFNYTITPTGGGCTGVLTATGTITVSAIPATPTATPGGPTTFCAGGSVTLTSGSATGNQWYLNGNPIGGATNTTYVAAANGNYTVAVITSGCPSAPSNAISVTVNPIPPTPTITPGISTSFCGGGTLTSSAASGNQWYLNTNPIGGATGQTYAATASGNYTVVVTLLGCSSTVSAITAVTVNQVPDVNQPASQTVCNNSPTSTVNFSGSVGGTTYLWGNTNPSIGLASAGGGDIPSFTATNATAAPATGAITVTPYLFFGPVNTIPLPPQSNTFPGNARGYVFTAPADFVITKLFVPTDASSGNQHIAVVKFNGNVLPPIFSATTNAFTTLFLAQNYAPSGSIPVAIQIQAGDVIGILGNRADLNSYGIGDYITTIMGNPVQLQRLGMQHTLSNTAPQDLWRETGAGTSISRISFDYVTNMCSGTPKAFNINVNPVAAVDPVADQSVCHNANTTAITFSSPTTGGSIVYNWTNSNPSIGLTGSGSGNIPSFVATNITGLPVTALITVAPSYTNNGTTCVGTTTTFNITVNPIPPTPTITPGGPTTFCTGGSVTLTSSSATGNQWYLNGNPIGGATNQTYVATATGNYTVAVTLIGCSSAPSSATAVAVNTVTGGTTGSDQTICSGGDPAAFTESVASTGAGALSYQWQSSTTSCAAGFSDIAGATGVTYDAPAGLATTTYYHRVTTSTLNTVACTTTGNCITVTINNVTGGLVGSDQAVCPGGDPAAFTSIVASGSGVLTYQWQSGTTSCAAGFSDIAGATGVTYDPPAGLAVTTYYHRITTSTLNAVSCSATGNCITVTVNPINTITLTSPAGTNAQNVLINTPIINITYSTTGATGAIFVGLPPGVTGAWAANVVTISGSPTAAGLYPYTVNLTGGCGVVSATGSINVVICSITRTSPAGTDAQAVCNNSAINNIIYSTTGATGASFSGLPTGVTGAWAANTVTISGTPSVVGTFNYTVTPTGGGCSGAVTATGTITVKGIPVASITPAGPVTICTGSSVTLTASASCDNFAFSGILTGASSVPANASTARGVFNGSYNSLTNQLTLNIVFSDLTGGNANAAHIHSAAAGLNGPVIIPFPGFPAATSGTYTNTFTVPAAEIANFMAGNTYINIHNAVFPGGEIRGQITNVVSNVYTISGALSGAQSVPPNASTATGNFAGTYNNVTGQLTLNMIFNNLVGGAANAAHIHSAAAGVNGPVIIPFPGFPAATSGSYSNTFTVPATEIANFLAGNTYINIHNAVFPGGEIRGQIAAPTGVCSGIGYLWNPGGAVTPAITVSAANTYSVVATINGCSSAPASVVVNVNPVATVNPVPNQVVCNGAPTAAINFSSPTPGGSIAYNWTNNTSSIGLASSGSGNIASFTATNAGTAPVTATITVTPTYTNGGTSCVGTPATFTITVNPTATVTPVTSQVVCNGAPTTAVNFTSPTTGGTIVYNWVNNTPSIGLIANGSGNIASFNATNAGTAPVVATITVTPAYTNGSVTCTGTPISFTITVNPTATVTPVTSQVVCNGAPTTAVNFTSPTTGGTIVYNWVNNTPSIGLIANGSGNIASFNAVNAGTAPVVATITVTPSYTNGSVTCVGTSSSFTITVNPTATVNAVANQVVCNNSPTTAVTFTSPTTGGTIVYNWTNNTPAIGLLATGSGNIASFTATNSTTAPLVATITVTPAYTNGSVTCTGTPRTFTITVNPTATVTAIANQVVCNGAPTTAVNFSSPTTGGTIVYNWVNNTPSIGLVASGSGNIASFNGINATNAPVTATITVTPSYTNGSVTCVGTPLSFTITVNPTATVNAVANQVVCNNSATTAVNFTSPTTGGTLVYNWVNNTPAIGLAATGNGNIASFTATNATTGPLVATITVTPSYTNGSVTCVGTPRTFTITVNPTATVTPVANQTLCHNTSTAAITFSSPTTGGTIVYNWTNNLTSIGLGASGTGNIPSFIATNTGAAAVTATITVTPSYTNGSVTCVGTPFQFTITVNTLSSAPTGAISSSTQLCGAGYVTLTAQGGFLGTGASYKWYSGSCGGTPVGTGPVVTNVYTYVTTTYYVRIEGICNTTTCQSVLVHVDPQPVVVITAVPSSSSNPSHPVKIYATVSPAGNNYQFVWSHNGVVMPGHPNDFINVPANQSGQYSVTVTAVPSGCFAVSNVIDVHDSVTSRHLFIQPNPNNGIFTVSVYATAPEIGTTRSVIVIDGKGSRVFAHTYPVTVPYDLMDVNINGRPKGQYVVTVLDGSGKVIASAIVVIGQF